jgi:hypothetical protein
MHTGFCVKSYKKGKPWMGVKHRSKIDLEGITMGGYGLDWVHLAQDAPTIRGLLWIRYWTFRFHKMCGVS